VRFRARGVRRQFTILLGALALSTAAYAQFGQWGRVMEGPGVPVQYPEEGFDDGAFSVCKLMYTSVYREALGMGWATDYPYAGINLMTRVS
jgi:hypothetical protein